jgi:pimeloyl-ACP methyl ester carboxylesterase
MTYGWDLMENYRMYGDPPYTVVVVHGGPGAAGEMAPVARELSRFCGVLEPFQMQTTLENQVSELEEVIRTYTPGPVTLFGHSWGAMFGFVFTAKNPAMVKKLILVASGPFEERYATGIMETRLKRLSPEDRNELEHLTRLLDNPDTPGKDEIFGRVGRIIGRADTFDPIPGAEEPVACQYDQFVQAWNDMHILRMSGDLSALGSRITCPVIAIHGDYDPHPVEGIQKPLEKTVKDFRCLVLEKCGHTPWTERYARKRFFELLNSELGLY